MVGRRYVLRVTLCALLCMAAMVTGPASGRIGSVPTNDVAHDDGLQWGFDRIGAARAWEAARGSGVVVAVVDSGVAMQHEDLAGQLVGGTACRNTDGDPARCTGSPQDDDGHGTHVAGIIAARAGNRTGIAGVAPDARIMPIKVLFSQDCDDAPCTSTGNPDDVVAAIRWAIAHGADIINLSLGSTVADVFGPEFLQALEEAWDAGVIPVIAAGNSYVKTPDFAEAHALVVAATDRSDGPPSYANGVGRARWAVAAPGGDEGDTVETCAHGGAPKGILSTFWAPGDNGAYACLSGTSMAAPHVSGALAILLSMDEYTTARSAIDRLLATAVDLGQPGRDEDFGAGLIDLSAAAGVTTPSTTQPPTSAPTTPTTTDPEPIPDSEPSTTSTSTTTTTTLDSTPTSAPPVVVEDSDDEASPVQVSDDGSAVDAPLAVGAGVLALGVAAAAAAMRRQGLV